MGTTVNLCHGNSHLLCPPATFINCTSHRYPAEGQGYLGLMQLPVKIDESSVNEEDNFILQDDGGSDLGHDDLSIRGRNAVFCLETDPRGGQLPNRTRYSTRGSTNHRVRGVSIDHRFLSSFQLCNKVADNIEVSQTRRAE